MKALFTRVLHLLQPVKKSVYFALFLTILLGTYQPLLSKALTLNAPSTITNLPGVYNSTSSPPSTVIAVSPNKVMQVVNGSYSITNHSGTGKSGPISDLVGSSAVFVSDPQVMWDPVTSRFYFSLFENRGSSTPDEGIVWGYSKTASPKSSKDFCTYFNGFNYGATSFPDRQSLGDSSDFLLIASNRINTSNEFTEGSDVAWIAKPPAGNSCVDQSSLTSGINTLKNPDGTDAYTPTPSKQVDTSTTGWILATPSYVSSNYLTEYSVTKNTLNGQAVISQPKAVTIPSYTFPSSAPQAGLTHAGSPAMPLQTRVYLTQVIAAYDPRLGHMALWTAHTVDGGAGTEVRWYEINALNASLDQIGNISDPNLDVFNGTISPDRVVKGSKTAYGDSAVISVNTSSKNTFSAIQMSETISGQPTSPLVMVQQSTGPDADYTCSEPYATYCRWGDYSASVPDPSASQRAAHGQVWLSNQWNQPTIDDSTPVWRTTNWLSRI